MTATLVSVISIFIGLIGANLTGFVFKKYSLGFTGNTIVGVFGSILIINTFGRLGFDPNAIVVLETVNYSLFALNCVVSFCSGVVAVLLFFKLKLRLSKYNEQQSG